MQPRGFVIHKRGGIYPPGGGSRVSEGLTRGARVISVTEVNDEPTLSFSDADLELLLAEADREDPILREGRPQDASRESFDSQILAGLVSP